jgi:outer membrane protein TolC
MLPRVNGFARYDWNSPTTLYAGRPNWTVGVMASWSIFGGGSELADAAGASARARSARAGAEGAEAQAQLEIDAASRAVTVAMQRLELAAASAAQSREAHRLVDKRYTGGLATIAERLSAEATATGAALAHAAARYAVIDAVAQHRRAIGADPGALARLDTDRPNATTSGELR